MQTKKNKNDFLLARITLCILILVTWTLWISTQRRVQSPETRTKSAEKHRSTEREKHRKREAQKQRSKEEINTQPSAILPKVAPLLAGSHSAEGRVAIEGQPPATSTQKSDLPKLATLTQKKEELTQQPKIQSPKSKVQNPQFPIRHDSDLGSHEVTPATRKALENNTKKDNETNLNLRNKFKITKNNLQSIQKIIKKDLISEIREENTWLPHYLFKSNEINKSLANAQSNLDQIVNQLELIGLVNNPYDNSAAIIRNKLNNKIKILKAGEKYQELTLLKISSDEVLLGNEVLNKIYKKRIIHTKPAN